LVSTEYEVQLSDSERSRYEYLKQELILQLPDGEVTAANAASLTGKLSQLANGAIYADTGEVIEFHDRKLDALEDIIEAATASSFLWWNSMTSPEEAGRFGGYYRGRQRKTASCGLLVPT